MMAVSIVPPAMGKKSAASTGFDADIAKLFENAGGQYSNGDLNARYGDRFYPAPAAGGAAAGTPSPQTMAPAEAAKEWNKQGFYTSFYTLEVPNWAVQKC